jgi:superfamily II DNA or RNA helicase
MPKLDLLVIDEAHHATAETYQRIIDEAKEVNPDLKLLGVTATPSRGDRSGLGNVFSNCAVQVRLLDVIADGHLVMPKTYIIDVGIQKQLKDLTTNPNCG